MSQTYDALQTLKQQIQQSVIGQEHVVDALLLGLLTNGNVLLEGLPGIPQKTGRLKLWHNHYQ